MDNPWAKANELWDRAHECYQALNAGARGGVSDVRRQQLLDEWEAAHREWWQEVQRVQGTP